jgi:hypothetical protein
VPLVSLDELQAFARKAAPTRHDAYSERALTAAFEEYLPRRPPPLARAQLSVDGTRYESLFRLLEDFDVRFETGSIVLIDPPRVGSSWDFLVPFERIDLEADGSAELYPIDPGSSPERAIARFVLREHYVPRSVTEDDQSGLGSTGGRLATELAPASIALKFIRRAGIVPFSVAILLYLPRERIRYAFDLMDMTLLPDPRAGRFAHARHVRRTSRVSFGVDSYIARSDLPLVSARALEVLVESHGVSSVELAHVFGGLRELVDSALQGLVARQLISYDRRTQTYRPRLEAFLAPSELAAPRDESPTPLANPALRTSVMELLAAADARATCPLCGDPLPPGHSGILCSRCASEVGAA